MITLRPVSETEFPAYFDRLVAAYADELLQAGNAASPADALERSRQSCESLIPQGYPAPDQTVAFLMANGIPEAVGVVWFGLVERPGYREAYVYDLEVYEPYRRRGYASAALAAVERDGRAHGASKVGLHVFGYNRAAIALYEKNGFHVSNLWMAKDIPPE